MKRNVLSIWLIEQKAKTKQKSITKLSLSVFFVVRRQKAEKIAAVVFGRIDLVIKIERRIWQSHQFNYT